MRSIIFRAVTLVTLFSCNSKKGNFTYQSSIGSLTYQADRDYLNTTLEKYANLSDTGLYFWRQDSILQVKILALREEFQKNQTNTAQSKRDLFDYYEKVFNKSDFIDFKIFDELRITPIEKISDVDLLELYIKRCFVSILNDNKMLPFNMVGTMGSSNNWDIKKGEEFTLYMNTTASNSNQPTEWYIVKDESLGLIKANILDTLLPDQFGQVIFKTTKYHPGENKVQVIVKIKTHRGENTLSKYFTFNVH